MRRRTKIVCTIGPATESVERLEHLIDAGMNVARLNFSHGTHAEHQERFERIRSLAARKGANVAIMMDLQGPKIRTGPVQGNGIIELQEGQEFTLTTEDIVGNGNRVSTTYKGLAQDVRPGDTLLLADGMIELEALTVDPPDVVCRVLRAGLLGSHKGINLPGVAVGEPTLGGKDIEDLDFGLDLGVDFVALSFVRSPEDVRTLRRHIKKRGASAAIVAKIERREAVDCFDEVLALSDAVMVARGDLGVEMDFEEVPLIQKRLIARCNELGAPVITATQMLESMVNHQRPTRAEVADVSNAISDGTDAVMLSGETAAGDYPIEACAVMAKVAFKTDTHLAENPASDQWARLRGSELQRRLGELSGESGPETVYSDAIGQAVCRMTFSLDIARIVCFTTSGYTAAAIARFRPPTRITAITDCEATRRRCALLWGVTAIATDVFQNLDPFDAALERFLKEHHLVQDGETIIVVAGTPIVSGGRTNLFKLHTVGEHGG